MYYLALKLLLIIAISCLLCRCSLVRSTPFSVHHRDSLSSYPAGPAPAYRQSSSGQVVSQTQALEPPLALAPVTAHPASTQALAIIGRLWVSFSDIGPVLPPHPFPAAYRFHRSFSALNSAINPPLSLRFKSSASFLSNKSENSFTLLSATLAHCNNTTASTGTPPSFET